MMLHMQSKNDNTMIVFVTYSTQINPAIGESVLNRGVMKTSLGNMTDLEMAKYRDMDTGHIVPIADSSFLSEFFTVTRRRFHYIQWKEDKKLEDSSVLPIYVSFCSDGVKASTKFLLRPYVAYGRFIGNNAISIERTGSLLCNGRARGRECIPETDEESRLSFIFKECSHYAEFF